MQHRGRWFALLTLLLPGCAGACWTSGLTATGGGTVRVTSELPATEPTGAGAVVGDFNGWDPYAHPLRRRANGARTAVVSVPAGSTLHFRYFAEGGIWFDDETASARDAQGACLKVPG